MKPFPSWRNAIDYVQTLDLDIWDVRIVYDGRSLYYVKAVRL